VSAPATSVENPFAGQGSVLLDIGGDIGALVVTMPDGMLGSEVEIRPVGMGGSHAHGHDHDHPDDHPDDHPHAHPHGQPHGQDRPHDRHPGSGDHLAHVAVVNRPAGDRRVPSLVFPELVTGSYELFEKGDGKRVRLRAEIVGGEVTALVWPT
jgi:hypothetical protein